MTDPAIDASIALAWLLEEERDPTLDPGFTAFAERGGWVPRHWHYEVRNGLLSAVRRERLSEQEAMERLSLLAAIRTSTDHDSDLVETMRLAFQHGLTFYDALYLELAIRRELRLATLDNGLARAASRAGVEVFSS